MVVHVLIQNQFHGEVKFHFLTEKDNHPQEDDFLLADEENLNDIKMSDDGLNMLGEWQEPEEATLSNIKKFRNAIRENIN